MWRVCEGGGGGGREGGRGSRKREGGGSCMYFATMQAVRVGQAWQGRHHDCPS